MIPLDPGVVFYALRALVRIGFAAKSSYEQSVRDEAILLPDIRAPEWTKADWLLAVFSNDEVRNTYITGPLVRCFEDLSGDEDAQCAAMIELAPVAERAIREVKELASFHADKADAPPPGTLQGLIIVEQWQTGRGPHSPWARLGLTLGHVVLESIQIYPRAFGLRGRTELYVKAFTARLDKILPNANDPRAPGNDLATRALAIALQAGFAALADLADEVIDEKHLQELVVATMTPLAAQLALVASGDAPLISVRDTVLGPVVTAAITTLARNQRAFLGKEFDPGTALGAVTATFLTLELGEGHAKNHLRSVFSEDGLVRVAKATLIVVAKRPELIVGTKKGTTDEFARRFVSRLAGSVVKFERPLNTTTAFTRLAVAALDSLAVSSTVFFNPKDPWQSAASEILQAALGDIADGLKLAAVRRSGTESTSERVHLFLETTFTEEDLVVYVKIFLDQASRTPGMVTGEKASAELKGIVASVTRALAQQEGKLLSLESVYTIAAVAAEEAAKNPTRLFGLDPARPEESLASRLIMMLLTAAAKQFRAGAGRADGVLMFGQTLEEAIVTTLRAASGNAQRALVNEAKLLELIDGLNALAMRPDRPIGRMEWLYLFRSLVAQTLQDPAGLSFDPDSLLALLHKHVA